MNHDYLRQLVKRYIDEYLWKQKRNKKFDCLLKNEVNMKNVVITGGNGYIGSHVVKKILEYPDEFGIVVACRNSENIPTGVKCLSLDILKDSNKTNLFEYLGKPDICIHLAWTNGFQHNAPSHIEELSSHFTFLKNLADSGTHQFIVAGSFREYGSVNGMVSQNVFTEPENLYALSKRTLKRALEIYFKDRDICLQWIRPFTVYGDDEKNNSIMSKIIKWEKENKKTFQFTNGDEQYDYIEIDQLAQQIIAIASQTEIDGVIDCCSGYPTRIGDKIEEFLTTNGYKIRPLYGAFPKRAYDSPVIYGDSTKIKEIMRLFQNKHKKSEA